MGGRVRSDKALANLSKELAMRGLPRGSKLKPTVGNSFERHIGGLVGRFFIVENPDTWPTNYTGLKAGDLLYCVRHSGDCFQDYMILKRLPNSRLKKREIIGSYGPGKAKKLPLKLSASQESALLAGETIELDVPSG